jgi:hypothetical protein
VLVVPVGAVPVAQRRFKENRPFDLVKVFEIIENAGVIEVAPRSGTIFGGG